MTWKGWLRSLGVLLVLLCESGRAGGSGFFIDAPTRVDAVYDVERGLVYISTSEGNLLRYDLENRTYLPPLALGGWLMGMDLSPDGRTLVVADRTCADSEWEDEGTNWIHVVDLPSWTARRVVFQRNGGETGTFTCAFVNDTTVITTSTYPGSGWAPMRRVDLTTDVGEQIAIDTANTMLSATADRSLVFYAKGNNSAGEFGVYDPAMGSFRQSRLDLHLFEAAANLDGSQFAIPTYTGMRVLDAELREIGRIGVSAQSHPIGVAYHPTQDIVYTAWYGSPDGIQAHDTQTLQLIGVVDDAIRFPLVGVQAFEQGRLRISPDGEVLLATVPGGVKVYSPIDLVHEDRDGDGIENGKDNCPGVANPEQEDADGDGIGDVCNDIQDADGDEWANPLDNCPQVANPDQADADSDGRGDVCDNCPVHENPDQADNDPSNGVGDACEDTDGDGLADVDELNLHGSDPWNPDTDGDGLSDGEEVNLRGSNPLEVDTDGDGFDDGEEVTFFGTSPVDFDRVWTLGGTLSTRMHGRSDSANVTGRLLMSSARTYAIQIDGEPALERGVWFEHEGSFLLYPQNLLEIVQSLEQALGSREGEPISVSLLSIRAEARWDSKKGGLSLTEDARCDASFLHSHITESLSRSLRATGVTNPAAAAMARGNQDEASSSTRALAAPDGAFEGAALTDALPAVLSLAGTVKERFGHAKRSVPVSTILTLSGDRTYVLGSSKGDPHPETGVWFQDGERILLYQQNILEQVLLFEAFLAQELREPVELVLTRIWSTASIKSKRNESPVFSLKSDARFDVFFPRRDLTLPYSFSMRVAGTSGGIPR